MTIAEEMRNAIREQDWGEGLTDVITGFSRRAAGHAVIHEDEAGYRTISRMDFGDGSFMTIDLTSVEDHLAFVPQGIYDREQTVIFHPEGVGERVFDLVMRMQAEAMIGQR